MERRKIRAREEISHDSPSVRRWKLAARATMGTALVYSALQYYFITVFMEIDSLPGITVFTGPIIVGVG
jgi:hypothetical protein